MDERNAHKVRRQITDVGAESIRKVSTLCIVNVTHRVAMSTSVTPGPPLYGTVLASVEKQRW
jgi:hypothetical protein